ncbi:YciI family protein [Streptosporangium sp. NPDC000396]|uniref:YciI family protein n=1 Tax=Streptosporangium sp. NPDC000396 TaxID=3366185 RepID=UPI0036922C70
MPQYLILIYDDEAVRAAASPEEFERLPKAHEEFGAANAAVIRGGQALRGADTATSIRPDSSGGFTITDGAFAETKEVLAGYYLIEVAHLDEALAVAKRVPTPFGGVEVRPIRVFD